MDQQQKGRWRPTRGQVLWTFGIVTVVTGLTIAVLIGYRYGITLWDWIKLLIVPVVIAGGGLWFNRQQRERELEIAREQREREVEIADRRAQDEALQGYLDQIGSLLLDKDRPLRQSKDGDEVRTLARARTLTVLRRLGGERKGRVLQFLYESGLITKDLSVLDLQAADLSGAVLSGVVLSEAALSKADLSEADLSRAKLGGANLSYADLSEANLSKANLSGAGLRGANLSEALLNYAILSGADLIWADLSEADLSEANLSSAYLSMANLRGANLRQAWGVTEDQIAEAIDLEGATMPNGQEYEDWLKSKGRSGNGEPTNGA